MPLTTSEIRRARFFENNIKPQIFEGLEEVALQALLEKSVLHDYKSGQLLVQQGDTPDYLYVVISGSVKTLRTDNDGNEAVIRMLKSGDTCMEAVIFMGGPSPIAVQVMDSAQLLLIPETVVKSLVLKDTRFAYNLLRIITKHYKNAMHQIDAMSTKTTLQRVGYYLLLKHLENGHDNMEFELPFKKATIASYLGMTPETFSRTLKQIRELGIDISGEKVRLHDSFALCHFCDSDTAALCGHQDKKECPQCPVFIKGSA